MIFSLKIMDIVTQIILNRKSSLWDKITTRERKLVAKKERNENHEEQILEKI